MNTLMKLSAYFDMINPIMIFILVLSAFLLLMYLKRKLDVFFTQLACVATDIRRIADNTESK